MKKISDESIKIKFVKEEDVKTLPAKEVTAVYDKIPGGGGSEDAVLYTPQTLTEAQKTQALANLGVISGDNTSY